jgi:hypothetical protein
MRLKEHNIEHNYKVFSSDFVKQNQATLMNDVRVGMEKFRDNFGTSDSTYTYSKYNVFSLTATSLAFYALYKDLNFAIKDYMSTSDPVWFQSWINFHKTDEVLKWHDHEFPFHGYITIDPKNTVTEFENYQIKNEVGNIYIGPGHRPHRVNVIEPFNGERVTLGFDLITKGNDKINLLGLIPIV